MKFVGKDWGTFPFIYHWANSIGQIFWDWIPCKWYVELSYNVMTNSCRYKRMSLQPRNVATAMETHVKSKHRPVGMVHKCVPVICCKRELQIKFTYRLTIKKSPKYLLGTTENSTLYIWGVSSYSSVRLYFRLSLLPRRGHTWSLLKMTAG